MSVEVRRADNIGWKKKRSEEGVADRYEHVEFALFGLATIERRSPLQ